MIMHSEKIEHDRLKKTPLPLEEKTIIGVSPSDFKSRLKKLSNFMSTEDNKPHICGILFQLSEGKLTLCATTGVILCEMSFPVEEFEGDEFRFMLSRSTIKHLIQVLPSTKDCLSLIVKYSHEERPSIEFMSETFNFVVPPVDLNFPDYKAVIPKGEATLRKSMQANYLIAALKALGDVPVDILVDDEHGTAPHLLTSDEAAGIKCVIMSQEMEWQ